MFPSHAPPAANADDDASRRTTLKTIALVIALAATALTPLVWMATANPPEVLAPALTERARRLWAATEARVAGRGGIAGVVRATGISYSTIQRGLKELQARRRLAPGRIRRPGGGRQTTVSKDPTLLADLEGLVEPTAAGDPMSPLRWTS